MSFSLHWRPLPTQLPEPDGDYDLKWALAKLWGEHDGSCREDFGVLGPSAIPTLRGIAAANEHADPGANRLIRCIEENPQGVRVWIGDPDDL